VKLDREREIAIYHFNILLKLLTPSTFIYQVIATISWYCWLPYPQ